MAIIAPQMPLSFFIPVSFWSGYLWIPQVGRNAEFKTWGLVCKCKKNQSFLQPLWKPGISSAWGWRGALSHIGTHTDLELSVYRHLSAQVLSAQLWSRPSGNKLGRFSITCLYQLASALQGAKPVSLIICRLNQTVTLASALSEKGYVSLLFMCVNCMSHDYLSLRKRCNGLFQGVVLIFSLAVVLTWHIILASFVS